MILHEQLLFVLASTNQLRLSMPFFWTLAKRMVWG
jgi:hypothetical protein